MFFSEKFNVGSELIETYGAVDISLICDVPLFVDPMLIFNSNKPEYKSLHEEIIKFFHFLYKKAEKGITKKEIGAWFNFKEVPNNWLGYSLEGNKGLALGQKYAEFLYNNIAFAINTNGLTQSGHIEKISDEVLSITRWKLKFQSIASSESQRVEIYTPDMRDNVGQQGNVAFWENVKFVWKFSCEDCQGNKHFYVASIIIPNTCEYNKDFWEVKKIG